LKNRNKKKRKRLITSNLQLQKKKRKKRKSDHRTKAKNWSLMKTAAVLSPSANAKAAVAATIGKISRTWMLKMFLMNSKNAGYEG
jgi:hypothetical protein